MASYCNATLSPGGYGKCDEGDTPVEASAISRSAEVRHGPGSCVRVSKVRVLPGARSKPTGPKTYKEKCISSTFVGESRQHAAPSISVSPGREIDTSLNGKESVESRLQSSSLSEHTYNRPGSRTLRDSAYQRGAMQKRSRSTHCSTR